MGLLDFMWGSGPTMGSTPPFNPYAPDPRMFDPKEIRKEQTRNALLAIGAGLASGNNWQEGISRGLLGGAQQWGNTSDTIIDRQSKALQMQYMQKQIEAKDKPDYMNVNGHVLADGQEVGYFPDENKMQDFTIATPQGPVDGKYNVATGMTNLMKPGGGFFTLQELQGMGGGAQPSGGGQAPMEAITAMESGGDPNAVAYNPPEMGGPAYGLTQTQFGTFSDMADKAGVPPQIRNVFNPKQNFAMGSRYYNEQLDKFGDPVKAAGAYFGGQDPSKWGPKTQAYMGEFAKRTGSTSANPDLAGFIKPGAQKGANVITLQRQDGTRIGYNANTQQDKIQAELDNGAIEAPPTDYAGNQKVELQNKFNTKLAAVATTKAVANKIKTKLKTIPVGGTGTLVQLMQGFGSQAKQLIGVFGESADLLDINQYEVPDTLAASSAALKSDIIGLAYSMAKAEGQGQITGKDIQDKLDQIGAQGLLSSPEQMSAALDSMVQNLEIGLMNEAQVSQLDYSRYPGGFGDISPSKEEAPATVNWKIVNGKLVQE